ncbi:MAG TPA: hypothetical protein PLN69_07020 [bacterium]|nr:hypothetical protein [bacterium]
MIYACMKNLRFHVFRICAVLLCLFMFAPCSFAENEEPAPQDDVEISIPVEEEPEQKAEINLKGYRYFKIRNYDAAGDSDEFLLREGLVQNGERVEQGTNLTLDATLEDGTTLEGKLYEMPKSEREIYFSLGHGFYTTTYGDFVPEFDGGAFAPFRKKINGIQFEYITGRTSITAITSKSKSQTKNLSFTGRNIKGPYDLNARDLVPEKATVKINDEVIAATEYFIDPYQGEITFNRILGPSDVVNITYEQQLIGSLNEGNILGLTAEQTSRNEKFKYGFTHLEKAANRQAQKLTESTTETITADGSTRYLEVGKDFIVRIDSTRGTETITKNGSTVLEPNVDYNRRDELTEDYMLAELYADGRFLLAQLPSPGDTFSISYSYYPENDVIRETVKELLNVDITGAFGYTQHTTIYSGSETIILCNDEAFTSCDPPLIRGIDYIVEEQLDRITFTPSIDTGRFVRIDYWYYPDIASLQSDYDHTVDDFRVAYAPDEKLNFEFEHAVSEADVSSRSISVLNETVRAASGTDLDCSSGGGTKQCTFSLANSNITAGTVVLYFNDRLSDEAVLKSGEYTIDYTRGEITFHVLIPAGTLILGDYQYTPDIEAELKTGNRDRFTASYSGDDTKINFSLDTGDTYFVPIGGEANIETSRLSYGFSHNFSESLVFSADRLTVENAADLLESHTRKNTQQNFNLSGKTGFLSSFRIGYSTRRNTDDYSPSQTDSDEDTLNIDVAMPVPLLKDADVSFGYSSSDQEDNTRPGTGTDTDSRRLGFNYRVSRRLAFNSQFTVNEIGSHSPETDFTSTNNSSRIGMQWTPHPLVLVGVDLDKQTTSDTRESVADREIQQTRINLGTKSFGQFESVKINYMKKDSPSVSGLSSGSKTTMYSTGYRINETFTFRPSLSITDSYAGDDSTSENKTRKYELDFHPEKKPYNAVLSLRNTTSDSSSQSGTSSTESDNTGLLVNYDPENIWSYSLNYNIDTRSSSSGSDYDTGSLDLRAERTPGPRGSQWISYQKIERSGSTDEADNSLEIGADRKMSELFTFEIFYRLSKFESSLDPERDFTGHLIESKLQATF